MSDIFLSYASADRDKAQSLARVLSGKGWSVWWDRTIPPGKRFDEVIEAALNSARCVVVLWSRAAVSSDWVKTEADEAARRGILIPALIEDVKIPLEFRRIQAADLSKWNAPSPHPELEKVLNSIIDLIGQPEMPAAPHREASQLMKTFDISIGQDSVVVRQGEEASLTFTVTNISGRDLRALVRLVTENDEQIGWLAIDGESLRDMENAQSDNIVVKVQVPRDAPPGAGKLRLVVASEENPDENFAEAVAEFTVERVPVSLPSVRRRWWKIGAAAGAVAATVVIIVLLWPEGRISIPSVVGMTFEEAKSTLQGKGFSQVTRGIIETASWDTSETAANAVCEQGPSAGTKVRADAPIMLTMAPARYTFEGSDHKKGLEEFRDPADVVSSGPITNIEVYELNVLGLTVISGFQLWYGRDSVAGTFHGYPEIPDLITKARWEVPDGDRITRVEGKIVGEHVTQLQFFTEGGENSRPFGTSYDARQLAKGATILAFKAPDPAKGELRTITGYAKLVPEPSGEGVTAGEIWKSMGGLSRITFHFSIEGLKHGSGPDMPNPR